MEEEMKEQEPEHQENEINPCDICIKKGYSRQTFRKIEATDSSFDEMFDYDEI